MGADDAQELRDSTEEFSVVLRDMQGLQERIKLLQEEIAASVQEANSRSLFVLTVVTVLALPINILAGLFGMNVGGVPLADNGHGFWIIVAVVAAFHGGCGLAGPARHARSVGGTSAAGVIAQDMPGRQAPLQSPPLAQLPGPPALP